jgi:PAS domain S-box-containing protein
MDAISMDERAVIIADCAGNIQFWSRGAESLLGYSAEEAAGRKLDLMVPEAYREQHWTGFQRAMEAGAAAMEGQSFDLPVRRRDGEILAYPATFVLVRDGEKKTIGAMAILAPRRTLT